MTSPADPPEDSDRTLADSFAGMESSGRPRLSAAEHRMPAAGADHDESTANLPHGEPGESESERAVRRAALDEMVRIAEAAGMHERAAHPRPMR